MGHPSNAREPYPGIPLLAWLADLCRVALNSLAARCQDIICRPSGAVKAEFTTRCF
jgi:hypothetical protein